MASKYWIKLYHEILDDPKMGQLPNNLWRRCIELFLMAGEYDQQGRLPDAKEMAWKLRLNPTELEAELNEIAAKGIIEKTDTGWFVVNFAKRQSASDSTERSRQQREREKKGQPPTPKQDTWAQSIYKPLPESPGIYLMRCAGSERYYVGGSVNIQKRIRTHLTEIKSIPQHPMHSDFITYGSASFSVEVLELADDSSQLAAKEIEWMSKYPADSLYNTDPGKRHHSWGETNEGDFKEDDKTFRPKFGTKRPTDTDTEIDINQEEKEADAAFSQISTFYQNEIGPMSPVIRDKLLQMCKDFPPTWIPPAITLAVEQNVRKLSYVIGILENWKVIGGPQNDKPKNERQQQRNGAINGHRQTYKTKQNGRPLDPRAMDTTAIEREIADLERKLGARQNRPDLSPG